MPDGSERFTYPLIANACLDHMERIKFTCTKSNGCTGCYAQRGELDRFRASFPRKSTSLMKQKYEEILARGTCIREDGTFINKAALQRAEVEMGQSRVLENAFWDAR